MLGNLTYVNNLQHFSIISSSKYILRLAESLSLEFRNLLILDENLWDEVLYIE